MKLKKFICLLVSAIVVMSGASAGAFASGVKETAVSYPVLNLSPDNYKSQEEDLSEVTDVDELRECLLKSITKAESVVDLRKFSIPRSLYENLSDLIWYGMPEAFNADRISFSIHDGFITEIKIFYRSFADTAQEYKKCIKELEAAADKLLQGIEGNNALSDVYKALLIHDRLCVLTSYCYTGISDVEHTAYSALVKRSAVCQGYSMAYMYLLRRVGIENYYCSSQRLDHAWNIVYINNKPYHVDVTWDDLNWEMTDEGVSGGVRHENFLRSTDGLYNSEHKAHDYDDAPSDTRYDDYFWQDSDSEFQLVGGKLYYINNKTGKLMCLTDKKEIADADRVWKRTESAYWNGNFARLSSSGNLLFYSLDDGVYSYDTVSGKTEKVYSPSLKAGFNIFGLTIEDGYIICDINNEPPGGSTRNLHKEKVKIGLPPAVITEIQADSSKLKTHYIGDSLDTEGLVVKAVYSDGSKKTVTKNLKFSSLSSKTKGTKNVTVTYKGFFAQFSVRVSTPSVSFEREEIKISDNKSVTPVITTKPSGQTLVWKCSSDAVAVKNGKIIGKKPGKAVVTAEITYNGKTYSDTVSVTVTCSHSDVTVYPEIPPTAEAVGYTEGVYCNYCEKFISGHKEIPKAQMKFNDSEKIRAEGKHILTVAGAFTKDIIVLAPKGSYIITSEGEEIRETAIGVIATTGDILVLPDKSRYTIIVSGDADGDGIVSAADARLALRISVGLEVYTTDSPYYIAARVESEYILSAADARCILRGAVGLESPEDWMR